MPTRKPAYRLTPPGGRSYRLTPAGAHDAPQPAPAQRPPSVMGRPWFKPVNSSKRRIAAGLDDDTTREPRPGERKVASFILPPFQRPPAWTTEQKILLIESLWDGLPVGTYVVNRLREPDEECDGWLLDGQQRWTAITDYVAGKFPVRGYTWHEITPFDRQEFRSFTMSETETALETPDLCERIYRRLAYGGTPHDPLPDGETLFDTEAPGPRGP